IPIIEPVQNRIVDAHNSQQQERISSHVSNGSKALPAPSQSVVEANSKARLNALYLKAQEMGVIEKGLGKEEGAKVFLKWAGEVLEAQIASVGQLTSSRLETLEAFLSAKDAA